MIMATVLTRARYAGWRRGLLVAGLAVLIGQSSVSAADEDLAKQPYIDRIDTTHDTIFLRGGGTAIGTIVEVDGDGNVLIEETSGKRRIEGKTIIRTEMHRSVDQVVEIRGAQALARGDTEDALKTIRWARDKKNPEAALKLAEAALEKFPTHQVLGQLAIDLYKDQGQPTKIEKLGRKMLKLDPHWSEGYELVAGVLKADPARESDLRDWLNEWNRAQPTAKLPNQYLAEIYEKSGDYKLAQEAYRKCWTLHKDQQSGLGYARVSLKRGDTAKAMDAAKTLTADPTFADEAKAITGSAKLAMGQLDEAEALLKEAVAGKLSDDSKQYATYNLGFINLHNNHPAEARDLWKQLTTPVADLALACLEHRPFEQVESLPSPGLKQLAKELNAAVGLERGQFAVAGALDPTSSRRALFLTQVAKVLQTVGSEASIRELAVTNTPESQRWQAYGHMLAGRFRECEQILDTLPESDGYALAYRLLIADARKDQSKAVDAYKKLANSPNAPREWLAKTAAIFESANDEYKDEQFDWPSGDTPQSGWQYKTPGTGIRISARDGKLWFEGTQAVTEDPVSHAFFLVRQERLRQVKLTLDLSGIGSATGGLEILDETRTQGVHLAVRGDSKLAWRPVKGAGAYGAWEALDLQIQGTTVTLGIDYANGRLLAFLPEQAQQKFPLGQNSLSQSAMLTVGIFGEAEAGEAWKLAADQMQIQLKPVGAPAGGNAGRFGQ
jgi:tetratricopeptide (TPR) repeat protein